MASKKWLSAALLVLLTSCLFETKEEKPLQPGYVSLDINLVPSFNALLKTASSDTVFTLDTLKIILSASGASTTTDSYAISGRADTGNISVSTQTFTLAPLRTWKAKLIVLDTGLNPTRTDTVYLDSVSFTVNPGDTTVVTKTANPAFSILRVRFVSNNPASITNNVKWVRLRVDSAARDSLPIGPKLRGVSFGNASTGTAVGDSGIILRTANTGALWTTNAGGTFRNLNAVHFPAANTGFAVGDSGTILKSTSAGVWTALTSHTTENLNGVHFSAANDGFAVGDAGTILSSNGTNWSVPSTNPATQDLNAVYCASGSVAYAVGDSGTIVKSTSGSGNSWTALNSGTSNNLNAVFCTSTTIAYAVGDSGIILKTRDGLAWSVKSTGFTQNLNGVYFTTALIGYAVGDEGTLLRTTDSAHTWTKIAMTTQQNLNAVGWTSDDAYGTAVGDVGTLAAGSTGTSWSNYMFGAKSFDVLLTYKYLRPNVSHALTMDAIDTLAGRLRGYQATKTVMVAPGKDTTVVTTSSLTKCGYTGSPNCL